MTTEEKSALINADGLLLSSFGIETSTPQNLEISKPLSKSRMRTGLESPEVGNCWVCHICSAHSCVTSKSAIEGCYGDHQIGRWWNLEATQTIASTTSRTDEADLLRPTRNTTRPRNLAPNPPDPYDDN